MLFFDSALLSQHTTFEFDGGEPGHGLHNSRYPKSRDEAGVLTPIGA